MRELRGRLKGSQKFASERNVRRFEELNSIKYNVTEVPIEFKASDSTTSEHKAGDSFLEPKTPVVHTSLTTILSTVVSRLRTYDLLELQKFHDNKVQISAYAYFYNGVTITLP